MTFASHTALKTELKIQTALRRLVLDRSVSTSASFILAFFGLVWILSSEHELTKTTVVFVISTFVLNLPRFLFKSQSSASASPDRVKKLAFYYRLNSYLVAFAWTGILVSYCAAYGVRNQAAMLASLIMIGTMGASVSIFAPIRSLSIGITIIQGVGAALTFASFATSQSDYILSGLMLFFTYVISTYTNEYYQTLYYTQQQVLSKESENESIKSLLNSIPGFMTLLDKDLTFIMANEAFEKKFNRQIIGKKLGFTGLDIDFYNAVTNFLASNQDHMITEVKLGKLFQQEHYLLSIARIYTPEERIAVLTMNIESQKKVEMELEEARRESEHASRLVALGEMMSSVVHEIRNPLSIIAGRAGYIKLKSTKETLAQEFIQKESTQIIQMTERVSKIMETVLRFSRGDRELVMTGCFVKDILEEAIFLTSSRLKTERVEIKFNLDEEDAYFECQQLQICQIFVNLINNSIDAIEGRDSKWIAISVDSKQDDINVRFTDCGPGIPEEIRQKLMTPFFTTKSAGKGTGLGLSISRGILERHHGSLTIDHEAKNTTFVITIPKKFVALPHEKQVA